MIFPEYNYIFEQKEMYLPKELVKEFKHWLLKSSSDFEKLQTLDYDYTLEVSKQYLDSLDSLTIEKYDLGIEKAFCLVSNYFLDMLE
jgi:hypothetical protein